MGLYVRQLLAGRDFAETDRFASQMANFVYLIGDDLKRVCAVVDPAWDIPGILAAAERDDMQVTDALITHYHPDHIGGDIFGHNIAGLRELLELRAVKIHANGLEAEGIKKETGVSDSDLAKHRHNDVVSIGDVNITLLHTPGHTPGSQCFLVDSNVVSGDTLFIQGCGRVDLPGGNPDDLYRSLTQVLSKLPEDTVLYPGHNYASVPVSTIGDQKRNNYYLSVASLDDWRALMGLQSE